MSASSALLTVKGLHVNYGAVAALRGVDLTIRRGRITALLGTNGAGKSSLLRVLVGLQRPSSGEVALMSSTDPRALMGYCPQELTLWPSLTVHEQLTMMAELFGLSRAAAKARADALAADLSLTSKRDERAERLSGGMCRRLSIAMAMVHDPDVLILDEAYVGLDAQTRNMLRGYLSKLAHDAQKAVVVSSHDIAEVERVADEVVVLDGGRCVAQGTPAELVAAHVGAQCLEDVFVDLTGGSS